ncbi:hypothetical protein PCE1_003362 [Barthelona sp. PCE]
MSISSFFVFCAFNTFQPNVISIFPEDARLALGLLYCVYAFSNLIAPVLLPKISCNILFAFSFALYLADVFAGIIKNETLFLTVSVFTGFGSAIFWSTQGAFILHFSSNASEAAELSSLFWSIFTFNAIVGFALSSVFHSILEVSLETLMLILCGTGLIGVFMSLTLPFLKLKNKQNEGKPVSFATMFKFLITKYRPLLLISFLCGLYSPYFQSNWMEYVGDVWGQPVFLVWGSVEVLFAMFLSRMTKKKSFSNVTYLYYGVLFIVFALALSSVQYLFTDTFSAIYFVIAVLYGVGDVLINNMIPSCVSEYFNSTVTFGISSFKFCQAFGYFVGFITPTVFPTIGLDVLSLINLVVALLACITLIRVFRLTSPAEFTDLPASV